MKIVYLINQVFVAVTFSIVSLAVFADGAKVTPLIQKELDGLTNKEGVMLIVEYAPGMSSKKHRHNAHTFVYVLEGAVTMQVEDSDPVTLEAGATFYESPKDIHLVSKNASNTEAVKFVVFSLKDKNTPAIIPVP